MFPIQIYRNFVVPLHKYHYCLCASVLYLQNQNNTALIYQGPKKQESFLTYLDIIDLEAQNYCKAALKIIASQSLPFRDKTKVYKFAD